MNPLDFSLERLFRAASRFQPPLPAEAPYYVEARILGALRRGLEPERPSLVVPLVRRASLCACAILVISAAWTLHSLRETSPAPDELVNVDSAIQLTLMQ
jgi:hypothetical protein